MKIYLVTRSNEYDYDEYDAFVVIANNEKEAEEVATKEAKEHEFHQKGEWKDIQYLGEYIPNEKIKNNIILGSYNAG